MKSRKLTLNEEELFLIKTALESQDNSLSKSLKEYTAEHGENAVTDCWRNSQIGTQKLLFYVKDEYAKIIGEKNG